MNALLSDEEANCTDGTQERDYMYVEDVARAFAELAKSHVQGAVNIGTGEAISIKTLVESIAKLLDKQNLLEMGAVPTDKNDPPLVVADASRLLNELKCKPEVSLDEGLRMTLEWWRMQRNRSTSRVAP
jgi:nucleoside-diphosphate-sugar epimerase